MSVDYAIIVKNKTRLETLIERFNTKAQAKFYIERLGGNFDDYVIEHDVFHQSLNTVQTTLSSILKNKVVERSFLPNYIFADNNVIVVLGQDGLVANTAKYAKGLPMIAINPDKKRYDGILLPFDSRDFIYGIENVLAGKYDFQNMGFAQAKLNDGQRLLAFNDLFIGVSSHVSARYKISFNGKTEEHSSSGLLVSTKAGATGWLSSVFNMAYGVAGMFDKNLKDKRESLRLSQQDVAILLGVSRVTYIKYEQDPDSMPLGKYEQLMAEFIRLGGIVTDRKIKSKGPDGDIDFDL